MAHGHRSDCDEEKLVEGRTLSEDEQFGLTLWAQLDAWLMDYDNEVAQFTIERLEAAARHHEMLQDNHDFNDEVRTYQARWHLWQEKVAHPIYQVEKLVEAIANGRWACAPLDSRQLMIEGLLEAFTLAQQPAHYSAEVSANIPEECLRRLQDWALHKSSDEPRGYEWATLQLLTMANFLTVEALKSPHGQAPESTYTTMARPPPYVPTVPCSRVLHLKSQSSATCPANVGGLVAGRGRPAARRFPAAPGPWRLPQCSRMTQHFRCWLASGLGIRGRNS
jgi:hypothetical protein